MTNDDTRRLLPGPTKLGYKGKGMIAMLAKYEQVFAEHWILLTGVKFRDPHVKWQQQQINDL